jgi:hypothetical protein
MRTNFAMILQIAREAGYFQFLPNDEGKKKL